MYCFDFSNTFIFEKNSFDKGNYDKWTSIGCFIFIVFRPSISF